MGIFDSFRLLLLLLPDGMENCIFHSTEHSFGASGYFPPVQAVTGYTVAFPFGSLISVRFGCGIRDERVKGVTA